MNSSSPPKNQFPGNIEIRQKHHKKSYTWHFHAGCDIGGNVYDVRYYNRKSLFILCRKVHGRSENKLTLSYLVSESEIVTYYQNFTTHPFPKDFLIDYFFQFEVSRYS